MHVERDTMQSRANRLRLHEQKDPAHGAKRIMQTHVSQSGKVIIIIFFLEDPVTLAIRTSHWCAYHERDAVAFIQSHVPF